ncbi:MAG: TIR domain-containing protein [Lachnospiraceae bacterium]|nr:TIR domain-containing protein [Lachnospiraceae bacterium]
MEETREYCAFISYRHKELDKYVAKKIHTMIERYTVPGELRKTWGSKKLGKVFRDEEELPVSSNLTDSICTALDHSSFLIVVCTPDTPESIWVEREIKYFLEHHDRAHVIGVLAEGTPDTSFPKLLTTEYDENGNVTDIVEPLAANLTGVDNKFKKSRMHKEAVRLYAAIMGCHFDSLWQREKRHNMKCAMALMAVIAAVALWYCISIYFKNQKIEEQNERISQQYVRIEEQNNEIKKQYDDIVNKNEQINAQNLEINAQNLEIKAQYEDIEQKNKELKRNEADTLIREGELLLEKGDVEGAKNCAIKAISTDEGREAFASEAEYLLSRALGACHYENAMRTVAIAEHEDNVEEMILSADGSILYTMDARGYVRSFSTKDGELIWKGLGGSGVSHFYTADRQRLFELKDSGLLLCINEDYLCALSLADGTKVWARELSYLSCSDFFVLSSDMKKIAIIDQSVDIVTRSCNFVLIDSANGETIKEIAMDEIFDGHSITASGRYCGVFSDDESALFGAVYYNDKLVDYDGMCIFKVDLENDVVSVVSERKPESESTYGVYPFVIGMEYYTDTDSLVMFHYNVWEKQFEGEEITSAGESIHDYVYGFNMPVKQYSGVYRSTYTRQGDIITASCGELAFSYSLTEHKFLTLRTGLNYRIYNSVCLNEENGVYAYLTEDGNQYIYWENGARTIATFSDRTGLAGLVISDGYLKNTNGAFGTELDENAVEAAVVSNNLKKVYILKPDKDNSFKAVDWYAKKPVTEVIYRCKLTTTKDDELVLWETLDEKNVAVTVFDAVSGNEALHYEFSFEIEGIYSASVLVEEAILWPDGMHFSYGFNYINPYYYDIAENKVYKVFDGYSPKVTEYKVLDNGEVLMAAICKTEDSDILDPEYELIYRIGNGDIQKVSCPEGKSFLFGESIQNKFNINIGSNGKIAVSLNSKDNKTADAYLLVNTSDNTSMVLAKSIPDTSAKTAVFGENGNVFLTADEDSTLRIYDIASGSLKNSIGLNTVLSDIINVQFVMDDTAVALWTKSRILYIYDATTGEKLFEGIFECEDSSPATMLQVSCIPDYSRDRIFFVTSKGAVMLISTSTWKKLADFKGLDAYVHKTGEIYRVKNLDLNFAEEYDEIIKVKAYTLRELEERTE